MRISSSMLHRQGVNSILDQQSKLVDLQNQLARGQRLLQAADDPAGMGQALRLEDALSILNRDRADSSALRLRLNIEESALDSITDGLQRIRELTVAGVNGSQSVESRRQFANEIRAQLDQVISLANTQDGTGRHIFGGSRDGQPPFVQSASSVSYVGDDTIRQIEVAPGREIADGESGGAVFLRIPNGNGSYRISASGNTGSATVSRSALTDPSAYDGQAYSISFSAGNFTVSDAGGGTVASGIYESGEPIEFAGLAITIEGEPADGDSLSVDPSRNQSLFQTVEAIVVALESGDELAAGAMRHLALQTGLEELDQGMEHISNVRGTVGARLSALDQVGDHHDAVAVELESAIGSLRDLDYAEATSRLALQLTGLEAAQQSFMRIQNLNLFRFMG